MMPQLLIIGATGAECSLARAALHVPMCMVLLCSAPEREPVEKLAIALTIHEAAIAPIWPGSEKDFRKESNEPFYRSLPKYRRRKKK